MSIYIGAAYYPEMWDEAEVDKDIERCKSLGVNVLRIAEFAWGKMEPEEGKYSLDWLKKIVDKLYDNGIYTVMCTPSATPPRWMLDKYTEMRRVLPDLIRSDVSSRCHVCKSSVVAREKNRLIVTELAKAFAGHKGIIGWQIDNEIFPYGEGCFCENCKKGFRNWLKDRFGTIENLNKRWGMVRWSLEYADFDAIQPPYPNQWKHPSLRHAWWQFQCHLVKTYVDEQAEVLHSFGCQNVGTDMMQNNVLSYYDVNENLDVVQFNHYNPASELPNNAFSYDFLRCVKDKPFWIMETQVGWNGSDYAEYGYRPIGNCYVNTWLPLAKGADMHQYWLFRVHPNGHEIGHGALFSASGRQYRVSEEVKFVADDMKKVEKVLTEGKIYSKIALHYSSKANNLFNSAPLIKNLNYREVLLHRFYSAFRHHNVDVIDTPHSLDGYEVVISPFLAHIDSDLKSRMIKWVNEGGTWIIGPLSDILDEEVTKYTEAPYGFLEDFAGVYTKFQKPIDNDVFKAKWSNGAECKIGLNFDAYESLSGTDSLAKYVGDEFDGLSVVTSRKVGKGRVILLGSVISHEDLLDLVGQKPIFEASDNVILTARDNGVIVAVETMYEDGEIVLDRAYTDLLHDRVLSGKIKLKPYEVLVLK